MNWILFRRLIFSSRIPNHCRVLFLTLLQLFIFQCSFFSIINGLKYKTVHKNSEWCFAVLYNYAADPQAKTWKKPSSVMPDMKNLGTRRQALSVLQFSKWIRYRNGTEHSKAIYSVFLIPNVLRASVCANEQKRRQTWSNLIPGELYETKTFTAPLCNPVILQIQKHYLKKAKIVTTVLWPMAKSLLIAAMFQPSFPPHLKPIKGLSIFHSFHSPPLLTRYYFSSNQLKAV